MTIKTLDPLGNFESNFHDGYNQAVKADSGQMDEDLYAMDYTDAANEIETSLLESS